MTRTALSFAVVLFTCQAAVAGDQMNVVATVPAANAISAAPAASVRIEFDKPVDVTSLDDDSFRVFGRWSGSHFGAFAVSKDGRVVSLEMNEPFSAGEQVTVTLSNDLAAADGTSLRSAGYSFQFWTRARETEWTLAESQSFSTNLRGESSTPYGGVGADLNNDEWLDLSVVNEGTTDVRTFMNLGAGDGMLDPQFLEPTATVGETASPSEPADFNNDGNTDLVIGNQFGDSVSILIGLGDGTFAPQLVIPVGQDPRGVAVLDADGDGDTDVVSTNFVDQQVALLLNDGSGAFEPATFFSPGVVGPWGIATGDMNEDGVLDLVMAARITRAIVILVCNGDGTFTPSPPYMLENDIWHTVIGDVNGDGHNDVLTSNAGDDGGTILLLDGALNVIATTDYQTNSFTVSPDLGDLDGDGDLDFVLASHDAWRSFRNNGDGTFQLASVINAPLHGSCSVLMDIDNDGDLDQSLIDEIADFVTIQQNDGIALPGDVNGDGLVNVEDFTQVIITWGACPIAGPCAADLDGDGSVSVEDLITVVLEWGACADVVVCTCQSGDGDCCSANESPGCNTTSCCDTVCSSDIFCCDVHWDASCADLAAEVCVTCGAVVGACCTPGGGCENGQSAVSCVNIGGVFQGYGSTCETECGSSRFISDDFFAGIDPVWTFFDPLEDSTLTMTGQGTTDALIEISVPAGVAHEAIGTLNTVARLMQPTSDDDFQIQVRFESDMTEGYQIQGIMVEAAPLEFQRFDFYSDGTDTLLYAGTVAGGSLTTRINIPISMTAPMSMRVTRTVADATWLVEYSDDEINWVTAGSYEDQMIVAAVGVAVANEGSPSPAHTARIDYVFNTASPIDPEDGG